MKLKSTHMMMFPMMNSLKISLKWVFPLRSNNTPRRKEIMMGPDRSGDWRSKELGYPRVMTLRNLFFIMLISKPMSISIDLYLPKVVASHLH